ncbi:MAG: hypothetical protein GW795_10940 [Cyanobacteria bacterium]|nr:hypothetical protein [Cyanobacteria bacterium CG_2015-16_32_12]NCQ05798.1 hypothetical protein [Cyanobacteria bacterium CG_2015-09_32_10]NCQ42371.1 hypothetical protein [Cyanobacteria bacterium CG_2015-04_32_10]
MGYVNVFSKLDQDISIQIKSLQAKQQELIEKKKNLLATKQKIQGFLSDAQEIKKTLEFEPDLIKSLHMELNKIFTSNIPVKKEENIAANLEYSNEKINNNKVVNNSSNLPPEEESLKIFKFIDSQGKNTSF